MTITLSRRGRILAAAAALLAAGSLAGCNAHPGKAALMEYTGIDGVKHTVTVSENQAGKTCQELSNVATCEQVLSALLQAPLMQEVADHYQVSASSAEVAETVSSYGLEAKSVSDGVKQIATAQTLSSKMQQLDQDKLAQISQSVQKVMANSYSTASPRYLWPGSWMVTSQQAGSQQGSQSDQSGSTQNK